MSCSEPPFAFRAGDDWVFPVFTYTDPNGAAIDLTSYQIAAEIFVAFNPTPIPLSGTNGSITLDQAAGQFKPIVSKSVTKTAKPDDLNATGFPTALKVDLTDPLGNTSTLVVVAIRVQSPREPTPLAPS